jgi:hypothetical protein
MGSSINADSNFDLIYTMSGQVAAKVSFNQGAIYVTNQDGISKTKTSSSYGIGETHIYSLKLDLSTLKYELLMDDVSIADDIGLLVPDSEIINLDPLEGEISLVYNSGIVNAYYVITSGFGSKYKKYNAKGAALVLCSGSEGGTCSYLSNCIAGLPPYTGSSVSNPEDQYKNVNDYCASKKSGECTYDILNSIQVYNENCAKEVYNYCIDVAYPRDQGTSSGNGISGITVCSTVLSGKTILDKVVLPIGASIGAVLASSFTIIFIIVIILLIVMYMKK